MIYSFRVHLVAWESWQKSGRQNFLAREREYIDFAPCVVYENIANVTNCTVRE